MADFRISGRVEHIGPSEFFVIASGVSEAPGERAIVLTLTAHSLAQANSERDRLMIAASAKVRARGDRVVET